MLTDIYYLSLLLIVSVMMPLLAIKSSKTLVHMLKTRPEIKSSFYIQGIVIQWLLTTAVLLGMWFKADSWSQIGFTGDRWWLWLALIAAMVLISLVFNHSAQLSVSGQSRIHKLYGHVAHYLPTNKAQYRWGVVLSITAGVCEEIVYRGFVFWRLSFSMGMVPAVLLTNLVFAFSHYSTGLKNAVLSFVLGVVFSILYLYTGDLWLSIICHVAIDLIGMTLYTHSLKPIKVDQQFSTK